MTPLSSNKLSSRAEERIKHWVQWIRTHQEQFWSVAGVSGMIIIMGIFIIHHRQQENEEAWNQLGSLQGQSMQGQTGTALKSMEEWEKRFQGTTASSYAKFLKGDLLYKTSDYVQAAHLYEDLAQTATPAEMRPLALSAAAASEEMAGHLPQAQVLAQNFADRYPDHFLAASVMLSQARLSELTGNPAGASALYDRFVILYPQSPWTALARARQQALSGPATTSPPAAK